MTYVRGGGGGCGKGLGVVLTQELDVLAVILKGVVGGGGTTNAYPLKGRGGGSFHPGLRTEESATNFGSAIFPSPPPPPHTHTQSMTSPSEHCKILFLLNR